MPVRYILSSVWVRLSIFSQLSIIQNMGLCVFSLSNSLVMIEIILTLSYYHHEIGSMNYDPLFRVRSSNNGMRCLSLYILILLIEEINQRRKLVIGIIGHTWLVNLTNIEAKPRFWWNYQSNVRSFLPQVVVSFLFHHDNIKLTKICRFYCVQAWKLLPICHYSQAPWQIIVRTDFLVTSR